ncbi:MAG: type II toxin-antitoxin system VapC family toxin [Methylobacillus sp.]|nr:type II toxin-antitoxin system VapC family toxin [Methylobacillus sp.]
MSKYLLDTNIISDLIRNPDGAAARRVGEVGEKQIFTSIIVAAELRYGCAKKGSIRLRDQVESLLGTISVLPLDIPADALYGRIRTALETDGQPIGANDLLIAAHALALGMTLVTNNTREFGRVRGLKIENWISGDKSPS